MARIRTFKPEFLRHEELQELGKMGRENGITLCEKCHRDWHKKYRRG